MFRNGMLLQIHVVNSDFESCNDLDARDFKEAKRHALRAALDIGTDEVCKGSRIFGAEVRVEMDGESQRFLVSMGQSLLK